MSRSPPITLTASDIHEFQRIYRDLFGTDISYEDAHEHGIRLVLMIRTLATVSGETPPE